MLIAAHVLWELSRGSDRYDHRAIEQGRTDKAL